MKCCAIGFSEADLRILETLVSMFRSKLHTNWVIDAAWDAAGCRLMLCDLDNGPGSEAWHREVPEGVLRAAVTAAATGAHGDLVLLRPLRGHGPNGLVHVLNLAGARLLGPPDGAGHAPPPRPPAHATPAAAPVPVPAMAVASPAPDVTPVPPPPPVAAPVTPKAVPAAPGLPVARPAPAAPSPAAQRAAPQPRPSEKPVVRQGPEKPGEEEELLDAMHRMRYQSRGIPLREAGLLGALRRVASMRQPAVVTLPGLTAALCLMPQERAYYSEAPIAEIARVLTPEPISVRVVPYGDPVEARDAAGSIDASPRSMDQLTWLACVRCPEQDTARHETSVYRLRRWPDLGQVPHEPHHLRWCGVLSRQPSTLRALAAATGSTPQDVAAFLDACAELEILESRPATQTDLETISVPEVSQQAKQVRERISLLRTILNKLGIRKS